MGEVLWLNEGQGFVLEVHDELPSVLVARKVDLGPLFLLQGRWIHKRYRQEDRKTE